MPHVPFVSLTGFCIRVEELLKLAEVQITLQTPFAGTALHWRLRQQRRLLPNHGWPHYTLCDVTYQPNQMTAAELDRGVRDVLRAEFSREASERRFAIRNRIMRQHVEDRS